MELFSSEEVILLKEDDMAATVMTVGDVQGGVGEDDGDGGGEVEEAFVTEDWNKTPKWENIVLILPEVFELLIKEKIFDNMTSQEALGWINQGLFEHEEENRVWWRVRASCLSFLKHN